MATALRAAGLKDEPAWANGPDFDEVDKIISVRVADVDLGDRLRPVDDVWAAALGKLMARDGQDDPITVCRLPGSPRWTLVAGAHRLTGAQFEEIEHLAAIIVGPGRYERRRREVSENLHRAELAPVDRAAFVAELYELLLAKAGIEAGTPGRALSAGARWKRELRDQPAFGSIPPIWASGRSRCCSSSTGATISSLPRPRSRSCKRISSRCAR